MGLQITGQQGPLLKLIGLLPVARTGAWSWKGLKISLIALPGGRRATGSLRGAEEMVMIRTQVSLGERCDLMSADMIFP
ncbi:hypothetical protein EJD96_12850 [Herbaspirillum seropedicae]|uniref:hypothetical protein n=1 Tax=Herbaspirillum seropedicae TaxID=964 RepID=UPI0011227FB1|nr:hypothetical protein [Herbaspirillum seropedicae]QDD64983.1 hypothetical protein EJD96_12850 [Herbaspirillum seropedicae]